MDGGKLYVSLEKLPLFLEKYFYFIKKENICLTERLGRNIDMRFFLDIDLKNKEDVDLDLDLLLDFTYKLLNMNPLILKCTQNKGYHLIYNKLVNYEDAKNLANQVYNEFGSIVDTSVYNTGLRMIGSVKYSSDKYENRSYKTYNFTFDDLLLSIVRIKEHENDENTLCQYINNKNKFLLFDLSNIHQNYLKIKVTKIKKYYSKYFIYTDSKFCVNKDGFHKNAKIFFEFDGTFLKQKCFCPCNVSRKHSKCKNFISKKVQVTICTKKYIESHI
tara:strand:- start:540 stop:1361 length:822 start_codon:yes stop_codon:yes gene_type:complete